jgi:type II secretory pathway pseudopilin PulG
MKMQRPSKHSKRAFTLLELTIVIMVLLALIKTGLYVTNKMTDWKRGREASETLRTVYTAQRMYLADNPTKQVSSIVAADIIPYMRTSATTLPTVTSLTGAQLSIIVSQSPPIINNGSGVTYDPSGSSNDSLWDVGQ